MLLPMDPAYACDFPISGPSKAHAYMKNWGAFTRGVEISYSHHIASLYIISATEAKRRSGSVDAFEVLRLTLTVNLEVELTMV